MQPPTCRMELLSRGSRSYRPDSLLELAPELRRRSRTPQRKLAHRLIFGMHLFPSSAGGLYAAFKQALDQCMAFIDYSSPSFGICLFWPLGRVTRYDMFVAGITERGNR